MQRNADVGVVATVLALVRCNFPVMSSASESMLGTSRHVTVRLAVNYGFFDDLIVEVVSLRTDFRTVVPVVGVM